MNWIYAVDLFGTAVFAISGVLTAIQKKFDLLSEISNFTDLNIIFSMASVMVIRYFSIRRKWPLNFIKT